ncbi:MAG: Ig-like domain-containing protein [Saprospiraceae bacterium]
MSNNKKGKNIKTNNSNLAPPFKVNKFLAFTILSGVLLPLFYLTILYSLTTSCAQQQQLTGGPRDTFPPNLIKELSTPNFQTNFEIQDISLVFDEYIELREVIKQVVVSPPLNYIPKVERAKGFKTATFKFNEKEVLKEGVTYAISYGKSIRDLTENNEVENLQFLFSTGDYIDSLKMSGKVVDVLTGEPVPEVLFMLYENFADTVVRTEKPYYFGKTDNDGAFTINYMKSGVFKGFALEDQDLNYLFNIPKERIGFTLDSILITDSTETEIVIQLFQEITTLEKPKMDAATYGFIKLGFKRAPYDAVLDYDVVGQELYKETEGDTIRYWYNLQDSIDWNLYFQRDTLIDTLTIKALSRVLQPIALTRQREADEEIPLNPFKPLPVSFNHPLKNIDTSLVNFREIIIQTTIADSTENTSIDTLAGKTNDKPVRVILTDSTAIIKDENLEQSAIDSLAETIDSAFTALATEGKRLTAGYQIDSLIKRTLILSYEWEEDKTYQLAFLPGALIDWYDAPNKDTILLTYEVKPKNDFGTINLTATEMDSTKNYWFQLRLGKNVVKEFLVQNTTTYKESFPALLPGEYELKIIEDLNGNRRWDPGNYDKKLQSEKISTATIEELRAGWDVEAEVKVDFGEKQATEEEKESEEEESN